MTSKIKNNNKRVITHKIIPKFLLEVTFTHGADIVKKILRESPSLASKKDENGFSALHLASRNGKPEVIREFLGEDPYLSLKRENAGRTPLHWAVMSGQLPVVEEFLLERDRPASFNSVLSTDLINSADNNGDTVLHLAAKMNCLEV